jgi:dolichol-phosphate mannosyltransferase
MSAEQSAATGERIQVSVVTPAYCEEKNLPLLYERLKAVMDGLGVTWSWLVVDDHSDDGTYGVVEEIGRRDPRVKCLRLARNSGSHVALVCALHHADGDCTIALAADLQDPPETIPRLLDAWRDGAQIVWAARGSREGVRKHSLVFSHAFYWTLRNVAKLKDMPATGADFFLLDRRVAQAFKKFDERNVSLFALITWMGFRQATIFYDKEARAFGHSKWTLLRKIRLTVDSVVAFSHLPVRIMSLLGLAIAVLGFGFASYIVADAVMGNPPEGWASTMVIILVLSGVQMMMLGVLGEYLWRTLDESRSRPLYVIESMTETSFGEGGVRKNAEVEASPASSGRVT